MALTKQKKVEILGKLNEVAGKNSVVFVNFRGLKANDTVAMRRTLRENKVSYLVTKKSLLKKAFAESKVSGEIPQLDGELAVVYGDDLIAPAREIFAFQKKLKENIKILGGVFENKYMDKAGIEGIALIPSHDTLKGMFVNIINSPIQGFVMSLQAIADKKTV